MRTAVFSIVSPNYRHFARVLMSSLEAHHPEWARFVLLVGESGATPEEPSFTTIDTETLDLPQRKRLYFRYNILELNTALKPWTFDYLFGLGYDRVIYLDPDTFLYSPLVELDELAATSFLVLTPHLTGSIQGDLHPCERTILLAGVYNLGFLSVSRHKDLIPFLTWWKEKLEYQCVVDVAHGLFVDQKWMDLTPGLFANVSVLRHDGYNVAYWNLRQRTVSDAGTGVTVNGQPLRFFHFSGVDPSDPDLLSKHDTRMSRESVGHAGTLAEVYSDAVREAGFESFRSLPYSFGFFSDGTPIPDLVRTAYRNDPRLQSAAGDDPFVHPEIFRGLRVDRDLAPLTARMGVASYRLFSKARPLVRLIPKGWRTSTREFLLGRRRRAARSPQRVVALKPGLNIVGYISRDNGVGEAARLSRRACEAAGLASHMIDVERRGGIAQAAAHRASIYYVNADQTIPVRERMSEVFGASSCNIGCWHWELPELPDVWIDAAAVYDEIWAPSAFVQAAVSRKVSIPVVHMPHGIAVTEIESCSPAEFGVPSGAFTFLCMFDLDSVVQRKNPMGAIEAFRRAFPADAPVALLIKTTHAVDHQREYDELVASLSGIPNIYLTDRMLRRAQVNGLLSSCHSVVSLHRSEGFGLILAEAMFLGKPVVATGWSGNMDFMDSGNSCPVAFDLVALEETHLQYEAGQQWAEPDLDHAASLMRQVATDEAFREQIGSRARTTMLTRFSPENAGRRYRRRLEHLGLLDGIGQHPFG